MHVWPPGRDFVTQPDGWEMLATGRVADLVDRCEALLGLPGLDEAGREEWPHVMARLATRFAGSARWCDQHSPHVNRALPSDSPFAQIPTLVEILEANTRRDDARPIWFLQAVDGPALAAVDLATARAWLPSGREFDLQSSLEPFIDLIGED